MSRRISAFGRATAVAVAGAWLSSMPIAGQSAQQGPGAAGESKTSWTVARTSWGDPDLQGMYTSNDNVGRRTLAPDDTGDGPEHWYERGKTSRRTSLVVDPPDGQIPLTADMRKRAEEWESQRFGKGVASWLDFDLWDRCITKGMPTVMVPLGYNNAYQIFQAPGYVAILYEVIHDVRIIPLDGRPHVEQSVRQWMGDSRGHWEGDTLVVEVTNFTDKTRGNQQPAGPYRGGGKSQRLTERYTRVGPDELDYKVTLEDPESFTRPWTMDIPLSRDESYQMFEYACHEGNYAMPHMLEGNLAQEKKTTGGDAAKKKSKP